MSEQRQHKKAMRRRNQLILGAGLIIALLAIAFVLAMPPQGMHIHVKLNLRTTIEEFTNQEVIPANIGVPGGYWNSQRYDSDGVGGLYPLHTRDESRVVHVESTIKRNYTLGDFFEVWGQPISGANILNIPNGPDGTWKMYVNGVQSDEFELHILKDLENIWLVFDNT